MTNNTLFNLSAPEKAGDTRVVANLHGASLPLTVATLAEQQNRFILMVVPDNQTALKLQPEIKQFTGQECHVFPDWETLPYDNFSPHQDIISDRIARLYQLPQQTSGILLIPVSTLMQRVMPHSFLVQHALMVKKGDRLSLEKLRHQLELSGYRHVDQVIEHGEYASRGSILDLFPMGSNQPYRIDFFDDEVDTIREFDPENQRSTQELDSINLLPAHEFPTDDDAVEQFRVRWRERFDARREPESIYQQVSKKIWPAGIEYWQPLFFDKTETLFDYLPKNTLLVTKGDLEASAKQFLKDADYRYDQRRVDPLRPLLPPSEIWQTIDELFGAFKRYPRIKVQFDQTELKAGRTNAPVSALPELTINQQLKEPLVALRQFTEAFTGKIVFSVETEGRREAMLDLLARIKIRPMVCGSLSEALDSPTDFSMVVGPADIGFQCENPNFALICESNLLGERVVQQRRRDNKKTTSSSDTIIRNLAELQIGQPVVHLEHGVGRYLGLQTLEAGGITTEYMTLEYQQGAKLYVPVASLHLISRYSGGAEESAPLHKLGGEAWEKARKRAAEKVRDVAAELLDVYAKRATKPGFAFKHDREAYLDFCAGFPFEETADQKQAINAVLSDMCQPIAMDRLVCGDVGFGKTEVAMRAAFLAVNNSKQVAVLVPTTLLAQQHFENFRDRFANQPVRVEVLSRFKSAKEQKLILADVAEGKVDILIGTHKLLQSDVIFHDLGLLIVDEEHRFGVRQKEKVKAMRANVDILTLTATPIPRTLNMAMSGMRDLSIIATPPSRRLAIKTFVRERESSLIREAVLREIMRGGQVYFLHNDIDSIEKTANELAELVPEARITVAHGQMRERELERIMSDFYHQRFNVLVCTTIIETGIDVPTANTIIMDRADHLGLAQLHQLRGRVGRSHHQAYAYLLTPHPKRMTKDAVKRLEAIASLEDLGAGFTLATHDLEIRGAGELLGDEQSGQIQSIGFTLYMEMLEQAVEALKEGKEPSLDDLLNQQTDIELRIPALLPDSYIPDVNTRLSLYKRIAGTKTPDDIEELRVELIDRFGLLPEAASNLLKIQLLKLHAAKLGIRKIDAHDRGGVIEFTQNAQIDPGFLVGLLQSHPSRYRFEGPTKLKIAESLTDRRERVAFIETLLNQFAENLLVA
ncbi:transcription-repair coupling factor [Grimontia hollisae]|uniref:transcription-repair coupling factor n=1 Tax=Grimontia hollisae TaxID=673 RepID=UPI000DF9F970|nr:transcription-repair coupling factor [Grimontia hollisae]STQ75465.1 Transcription-repair-coupling factor [Grimontia hollisae]